MSNQVDLSAFDRILDRYPSHGDVLITLLQEIQRAYGYLPEPVLVRLSRESRIPLSRIYGVITFYSQFYLTPRGRNIVRVCRGTACHVRGSAFIMDTLSDSLGIAEGETTNDMQFSLETVACVGTCFLAPVMMVNTSFYGKLDPRQARDIVDGYAESKERL